MAEMKKLTLSLVVGITFLGAIAFGVNGRTNTSARETWEYKSMPGAPGMAVAYNHLGNDGWELVAVTCSGDLNQCSYYFKRKK